MTWAARLKLVQFLRVSCRLFKEPYRRRIIEAAVTVDFSTYHDHF